MHFDDRLGTVLRLSASGPAVQRIQYRQLLDLLGTLPASARGDQLDAAYVRLAELAGTIPASDRARAIKDAGLRLRSPRLVAFLAQGEPAVAAAAIGRASLSGEEWLDLIPALPPSARPDLLQRRDLTPQMSALLTRLGVNDRGLPPAQAVELAQEPEASQPTADMAAEAAISPQTNAPDGGIGAIVKRIEAYRKSKQVIDQVPANDSPRLPLGEDHVLQVPDRIAAFDFATDAEGRITWSDPGVAPMLLGTRLAAATSGSELIVQMRRHQPLHGMQVNLGGGRAISGTWQLDAAPWFDPLTGRYIGHRGRMRRPAGREPLVPPVAESEADRIRQMLHELRTPVNAIQGFAEVIQQQLFGPTPHDYRAIAAGIAGDAARMLSAFEELERLARLDSGAMDLASGETDLAAVLESTISQLAAHTAQRDSGFALKIKDQPLILALDRLEVERIVWRLLATLAGVSAPGEKLKISLKDARDGIRLDLQLPAALAARTDDELYQAAAGAIPQTISAGVFGVGFALRLARAEARASGGDLVRKDDKLRLTLPGLTDREGGHTEKSRPGTAQAVVD